MEWERLVTEGMSQMASFTWPTQDGWIHRDGKKVRGRRALGWGVECRVTAPGCRVALWGEDNGLKVMAVVSDKSAKYVKSH